MLPGLGNPYNLPLQLGLLLQQQQQQQKAFSGGSLLHPLSGRPSSTGSLLPMLPHSGSSHSLLDQRSKKPAPPPVSSASSSTAAAKSATSSSSLITTEEIDKKCESYCKAVYAVAERYLKHMPAAQRTDMRRLFNTWKDAPDKLDVSFMYKLSGWRAVYTQNLFRSRIQTVWLSLRQLMSPKSGIAEQLSEIFGRTQRVVSIGCGPGPCVAAMLIVLREFVGITQYVKLIGIDQFIGWGPYVVSMNGVEAAGASGVEFWHERVEEATIDKLPNADVAIMSYTDAAVHTPKFWETMRLKYAFILVLDQRKGALSRELQRQGFCHFEYEFKGSKRVFYYINPFGELLKLAHSTTSTAAGGCDRPRFAAADSDDSDELDSDSSSNSSADSSLSDNDGNDSAETDKHIEKQVASVVQHLLAKVEQHMSLGLARTRTRDRRRAMQEATSTHTEEEDEEEVPPELEREITQRLLAAVDTMSTSLPTDEDLVEAEAGLDESSNPDELATHNVPSVPQPRKNGHPAENASSADGVPSGRGRGSAVRKKQQPQPSLPQMPAALTSTPVPSRVRRMPVSDQPSTVKETRQSLSKAQKDELLQTLLREVSPEPEVDSEKKVKVQAQQEQKKITPTKRRLAAPPATEEKVLSVHMPDWARDLIAKWSHSDPATSPPPSTPPPLPSPAISDVQGHGIKRVASQTGNVCPPKSDASSGVRPQFSGLPTTQTPLVTQMRSGAPQMQVRAQVQQVRAQAPQPQVRAQGQQVRAQVPQPQVRAQVQQVRAQAPQPQVRAQGQQVRAQVPQPQVRAQGQQVRAQVPQPQVRAQVQQVRAQAPQPQVRAQAQQVRAQAPQPQVRAQIPQMRTQAPQPQVRAQIPQVRAQVPQAQMPQKAAFFQWQAQLQAPAQQAEASVSTVDSGLRPVGIARPAPHGAVAALPPTPQSQPLSSAMPPQFSASLQPQLPIAGGAYYPGAPADVIQQQQPPFYPANYQPMYATLPGAPYYYVMSNQPPVMQPISTADPPAVSCAPPVHYMPALQFMAAPEQLQSAQLPTASANHRLVLASAGVPANVAVVPAASAAQPGNSGGSVAADRRATKRKHERKAKSEKKQKKKKKLKKKKRKHRQSDGSAKKARRHSDRRSGGRSSRSHRDSARKRRGSDSLSDSSGTSESRSSWTGSDDGASYSQSDSESFQDGNAVEEFVSEDSDLEMLDYRKHRSLAEEQAAKLGNEPPTIDLTAAAPSASPPSPPSASTTRKKIKINRDIITID